jgi:PAS domain S-box-containing protein
VKLNQRDNKGTPSLIHRRPGMTLRDRLSALQISAQSAGTRIVSYTLVISGVVVGGLGVGLISKWATAMSHPRVATALLVFLGVSLVICSWALKQPRRESAHQSEQPAEAEDEYAAIFSRALDATLVLDDRRNCLRANPAAADLLGVTEAQLSGCPFERLAGLVPAVQSELLESGNTTRKTRVHRPDGTSRMVESLLIRDGTSRRCILFLRDNTEQENAAAALREHQERFLQMASNIGEIFWMLDAASREILYISPAYETITGRTCRDLYDAPTSYEELFYPEDRIRVLTRIEEATKTGLFDEEFRIMRPDGTIRWVWVRGFPVRDQQGQIMRLVGTAQDTTIRKSAESSLANQLRITETARAEAEALRKSTLALTQTLNMEAVLDTLLECLAQLVPCDLSDVLLLEDQTRLFGVGGRRPTESVAPGGAPHAILTIDVSVHPILTRMLKTRQTTCIANTLKTPKWVAIPNYENALSWLGVPLVAGTRVIGLLCLGKSEPNAFTGDHIRFAESIATPAAIAIQNARLFERGEIYATELEQRLNDLRQAQKALQESEDRYRDLVESSEDLICTHNLEGKLLSVNELPVKLLGYSQEELLNKPMRDFLLPEARAQFDESLLKIKRDGFVKGSMVVLTKTGERRIWEYHNTLRTDGVAAPIVRGIAHDVTDQRRMQKALRLSEEKFSKAFRSSPVAITIATLAEGKLFDVNGAFEKQFGYNREEVIGRTALELGIWNDPDERTRIVNELQERGSVRNHRLMFRKKTGERVVLNYSAETIELEGQRCILAAGLDITESELAQKLIAGENCVLEMIAQGRALPLNLYALCQVIEEQADGVMCATSLLDEERDDLYCVAAPSLSGEFKSAMDGRPIGPKQGSCGTAAFRREIVVVADILCDSLWDDYRHLATAHGLRACWSSPIFSSRRKVIGTFDMYFKEPRSPNDRELALIARATHIAGIATERDRGKSVFRFATTS